MLIAVPPCVSVVVDPDRNGFRRARIDSPASCNAKNGDGRYSNRRTPYLYRVRREPGIGPLNGREPRRHSRLSSAPRASRAAVRAWCPAWAVRSPAAIHAVRAVARGVRAAAANPATAAWSSRPRAPAPGGSRRGRGARAREVVVEGKGGQVRVDL